MLLSKIDGVPEARHIIWWMRTELLIPSVDTTKYTTSFLSGGNHCKSNPGAGFASLFVLYRCFNPQNTDKPADSRRNLQIPVFGIRWH